MVLWHCNVGGVYHRPDTACPGLDTSLKNCIPSCPSVGQSSPPKDHHFGGFALPVRRLLDDKKTYVNLECYDDKDYVNFDMITK
ncbi:hypothetical protein OS493_014150 [Desmophyllum pertusum]|uniref:Uncharacterized protein n=1 Tax=Desmophyllum pertusum TaxID=174260 RepID=A0A9W9ZDK6_9CNID|nr:hypothetical protein OS493_014150 [Desmophyllum pertusum]